jgi:hypothetical protein
MMATAAQTSAIPKTANWARNLVLHRVATDPNFAKLVEYAAKNRIPQTVANAALMSILNQTNSKREGFTLTTPTTPTTQDAPPTQVAAPDPALTKQQQMLATATSLGGNDADDTTPPQEEEQ